MVYIQKKGTLCFTQGGERKCYYIPVFGPPVLEPSSVESEVRDGEQHYIQLFADASALQSLHRATRWISDSGTRAELERGIASAVKAMEKRGAAQKVEITLGD
jgi:hypothetical protein